MLPSSTIVRVAVGAVSDQLKLTRTPTAAADVPGSAEQLTTEWLSHALCSGQECEVTAMEVTHGSDGTSSRRAIRLEYSPGASDLPERIFTKSSSSFATRLLLGVTGLTQGEEIFFNDLRQHVELRSPRAYFAASDPRTCRSIVIMEDLADQGWTFPDPMNNVVTEQDAQDMVDELAAFHAVFWDSRTASKAMGQLQTPLAIQQRLNRVALFPRRVSTGLSRAQHLVPQRLWQRREELWPAVMHSLKESESGPQTLLHHDVHIGNWLRDPNGRMGLYDWQVVCRGHWAIDVSYALVVGLATEDRRSWEQDLLRRYVAKLKEYGVTAPPSFEQALLDYRRNPMHAYAFGVFTNGQPWYLPELQPEEYTLRSLERIVVALDDLGTLDALRH